MCNKYKYMLKLFNTPPPPPPPTPNVKVNRIINLKKRKFLMSSDLKFYK